MKKCFPWVCSEFVSLLDHQYCFSVQEPKEWKFLIFQLYVLLCALTFTSFYLVSISASTLKYIFSNFLLSSFIAVFPISLINFFEQLLLIAGLWCSLPTKKKKKVTVDGCRLQLL